MYQTPHPDEFAEPETDDEFEDMLEGDVSEMVKRLASAMDGVIAPGRDSRMLVAEALMRLALGVHVYAAGPDATRERLLAMALRTGANSTTVN